MKKKFILSGCILVLLLFATMVSAEGLFISGNIGASELMDSDVEGTSGGITETATLEFDTGLTFGLAIGHDFGHGRVELAVDYKLHDLSRFTNVTRSGEGNRGNVDADGDISALSAIVNGYYDIHLRSPVTPYIGGGAGYAKIIIKGSGDLENEADTVFAYQIAVGIGYDIDSESILDIGYRFFGTSDIDFDGTEAEYYSHNIVIGLRL